MSEDVLKITEQQHDNFIWTWKSSSKSSKVSLWIPYFSEAKQVKKTSKWIIIYNGGEIEVDLKRVDLILFYGASGSISLDFLDGLSTHKIIFIFHRRNKFNPYYFLPFSTSDTQDILSKQIAHRSNNIKRVYVARTLIHHKLNSMSKTTTMYTTYYSQLGKARTVDKVRNIEAQASLKFWSKWYADLNLQTSRRTEHALNTALNAGSKFLYGIILRWVLMHKLSPCHGFLHLTTEYPSLIYDLIEPYRYILENAAKSAYLSSTSIDSKELTAKTIDIIKDLLEQVVYVPATRQYVRRKNLLHGIVLALRAYLIGDVKRFIIPVEGEKKGGRPLKVSYKLPGDLSKF